MADPLTPDLCVIGAGSGGLTVAAGASQMGASVVLVEGGEMGGDCLNHGCVPSKALIAAARDGADFATAMARVRRAVAAIAPNDSAERFEALGCTVIRAHARFTDPRTVEAGGRAIRARRFVVATGARPLVPAIPGLADVPYLTNETVFDLAERPDHLLVLGGGPVGVELAQAFARLGARVSVIEAARLMPREDPELVEAVRTGLRRQGVTLVEGARAIAVSGEGGGLAVTLDGEAGPAELTGSHLLVAVGRRPSVEGLGLDEAGVKYGERGIVVDAGLRTTNRRIYAIGDVLGGPHFTHLAAHHATVVLKRALFRLPVRADRTPVPRVTFTDPELAQAGLTEAEARERHGRFEVLRWAFSEIDRARTDGRFDGLAKVLVGRRGRILGAGIVGPHAGELIQTWQLAMENGLSIGAMAGMMVPYPTFGEVSKRAAASRYVPTLFSDRTKALVRLLARLG